MITGMYVKTPHRAMFEVNELEVKGHRVLRYSIAAGRVEMGL